MERKYVILADGGSPVIFGPTLTHREVAGDRKVESAGFFDLSWDYEAGRFRVIVYGSSFSLKTSSRPDIDSKLLERILNND